MAYVGAAYTIDPFCRTPDDVIDEVRRKECAQDRPQPKHKRVWVEMTGQREDALANGKTRLFAQLGVEVERDRKSTRLNSSHTDISRMPSSA